MFNSIVPEYLGGLIYGGVCESVASELAARRNAMEKATGNVKVVNLTSNISALITFILAGKILWVLGLSASVFSIAGHYLGAHMVVKNGVKIIKPIILLVLALLLIKIVLGI